MEVYEAILSRRSIRRFQQKPISIEILKKFVNAARLAPSAANLQPLEFFVVTDKKSNKAIGMGRIISDGVSDAYLQDIIVLPDFRGQGIGKKLTETLIQHCLSKKLYWIALIAEPDQDGFYKTLGFKNMKDYVPMKYETEE